MACDFLENVLRHDCSWTSLCAWKTPRCLCPWESNSYSARGRVVDTTYILTNLPHRERGRINKSLAIASAYSTTGQSYKKHLTYTLWWLMRKGEFLPISTCTVVVLLALPLTCQFLMTQNKAWPFHILKVSTQTLCNISGHLSIQQ